MPVDAALLEADRQARQDALDVSRSFIVQAPAGSGKTELLIQRYLCLLAIVSEPEEVVAITFTRKAALEMQLRVIEALQHAGRGMTATADHERRTLAAAAAVLERSQALGWQLQDSPRRMRIQTLDAFCASVARLLPVSSGLGGLTTTAAGAEMTRLYREAAAATLDWMVADRIRGVFIERILEHLDNNTADYIEYLASMLGTRDQWLSIVGSGEADNHEHVRRELEATMAVQIGAQLQRASDALRSMTSHRLPALARYAATRLEETSGLRHPLAGLPADEWPDALPARLPEWRAIANLLLTQSGAIRKRVNKNDGFPPGDQGQKSEFENLLSDLCGLSGLEALLRRVRQLPDAKYGEEQWQVLLALFRLLPVAVGELRALFAERGVTDHIEVANAASLALGNAEDPGNAAMLLDYRIQHLLVDEMQDTSTGQYRLLRQLTVGWEAGDGRTLFCVGDPMQSVYRFRDAEVGQFLAARRHGIGELPLESRVLRRNFRSGEHLVHWFNTVFAQILPDRNDIGAGAIRYSESVPVEAHKGKGAVTVHPLFGTAPLAEAKCSMDAIRQCLDAQPHGDVAVLVRSRTQLPLLLAELRAAGVPYKAIEIDRLTDLPEIIDLLALTRALCHRDDRIAWLGLLRAPWAGLSWRDIHCLVRNDRSASVMELLRDEERLGQLSLDGRRRLDSFLAILSAQLPAHGVRSLRERVECAWFALGGAAVVDGEDALGNVYRYLDVLERLEVAGTLPDVAMLERQLDEERVSSIGEEHCRVQVMTMHKAKGLQFDHVVLHGLGRASGRYVKAVLNWMSVASETAGSSMIISPLGPRSALENDPLHRYIEEASKDAERLELDRLLYVACTRARRSLHLIGAVRANNEGDALRPPVAGSLLHRLWPVLVGEFEKRFESRTVAAETPGGEDTRALLPPLRRFVEPWKAPQAPALPGPSMPDVAVRDERPVDYDWVGSAARHAGTIVHRWLQRLANDGQPVSALPPNAQEVSARWARSLGVANEDLDAVWQRVRETVRRTLDDRRGRWLLFGSGYSELRLTGMRDGRSGNIVIDRVRIDEGEHWIVDYKTSSHEGGDLQGFLAQEVERYRPQLCRYGDIYRGISEAPLRLALYFPLLQQFVEVEAD